MNPLITDRKLLLIDYPCFRTVAYMEDIVIRKVILAELFLVDLEIINVAYKADSINIKGVNRLKYITQNLN